MLKYMYYDQSKNKVSKGTGEYSVPRGSDFVCIFTQNPTEELTKKISKDFNIDKKYFKIYAKEHRSVRYSINPLVFVFMDYFLENNRIKNSRFLFILKENALIIVMQHKNIFHNELFDSLVDSFEHMKKKSLVRLMYQFLMEDVEENYEVLEKVESIIMDLERDITAGKDGKRVHDIIKFKRAIYRMSRRFWGSAKIVFVIKKGLTPLKVDVESVILLDDVYNTYMHQIDILASGKEMLSDILAIHDSRVQNDLNLVIKKLTAITVILAVPTLIASVYGMNFKTMPEIEWQYGYLFSLMLMLTSIFILVHFFHKKKWM